jgi:hypothetical protein
VIVDRARNLGAGLLLAFGAAHWPAAAQPMVHRCVDGAGKVSYQAQACDTGSRQTEVRLPALPPAPPASARVSQWKGYVPPKVAAITFYYDPAEEPVGFSTAQMEAAIRSALAAWGGCHVRLAYAGRAAARLPGTPERVPIRWEPKYMRKAHPADARSGLAATGSLFHGISLRPWFHESNMLPVLVHEVGHVLGLPHFHDDADSIMSYLQDESLRRKAQPSQKDLLACNLSMKRLFGIEYEQPSGTPDAPVGSRMTDREAADRLRARREAETDLTAPLRRGSQQ